MRSSIRARLQGWYALVLLAVVAGFAGLLFYRVRAARYEAVDTELETVALSLDVKLRPLVGPPPPRRPPEDGDNDRPPPPPGPRPGPPDRERLLTELDLPGKLQSTGGYFVVLREDGSILKSGGLGDNAPPIYPDTFPSFHPLLTQRGDFHEAVMLGPGKTRILVGRSVREDQVALNAFAIQLVGVSVVVLAIGLAGGWLISARLLRPLAAISATASAISATNLSERIPPETVDRELMELAGVLNAMFDRLEASFKRQARFTADASHELRTPLAIIRTHAELALSRPRTTEEYRKALETCVQAAGRMSALVDGLLTLARADAGKVERVRKAVDLRQLVEESVVLLQPLATEKGVIIATDLEVVEVAGDGVRLAQVIVNLLHNAVQYNRSGGTVRVELRCESEAALLSVTDSGCGIPEEDQLHLFERFYRVDKARARASGGNGLGLAICKSFIEGHGGTIGFTTVAGQGSTFWVRLPAI